MFLKELRFTFIVAVYQLPFALHNLFGSCSVAVITLRMWTSSKVHRPKSTLPHFHDSIQTYVKYQCTKHSRPCHYAATDLLNPFHLFSFLPLLAFRKKASLHVHCCSQCFQIYLLQCSAFGSDGCCLNHPVFQIVGICVLNAARTHAPQFVGLLCLLTAVSKFDRSSAAIQMERS